MQRKAFRARRIQGDISTDDIIPAQYKHMYTESSDLAPHIFENLLPGFAKTILPNDAIVCEGIFGIGSSREQAVSAMLTRGIKVIIAPEFGRIFYRNAWNLGLIALQLNDCKINELEQFGLNLSAGTIESTYQVYEFIPPSESMIKMLEAGGLLEMTRKAIIEQERTRDEYQTACKTKFDGLATDYDEYRPRYPLCLIEKLVGTLTNRDVMRVVDIGAGTGIALEPITDILGSHHDYHAIDISSDMINKGKSKFSYVKWHLGKAEEVIPSLEAIDLVIAAQSFQWMDRAKLLAKIKEKLAPQGVLAIIQNNRNFEKSHFLADYESLLEEMSPGYSRFYRFFDFKHDISEAFNIASNLVQRLSHDWVMTMPSSSFVGMNRSSTQAQRAIALRGNEFITKLKQLIGQYEKNGKIEIVYRTELFLFKMSG